MGIVGIQFNKRRELKKCCILKLNSWFALDQMLLGLLFDQLHYNDSESDSYEQIFNKFF